MERLQTEVALPTAGAPGLRYAAIRVKSLLRQQARPDGGWHWRLDPYEGCQLACVHCPVRLDVQDHGLWRQFQSRIAVKVNAAQVLRAELHNEDFSDHHISIGEQSDAWQHAEEQVRLTRALLEILAEEEGRELRIATRASLVARDGDLLRRIASRNHVVVTFSLPSLDERVNRLIEPYAPSAFRRLAAMEALARLGVQVGLNVGPVFPGMDDDELQLKAMLTRAANAGARFANLKLFTLSQSQREGFMRQVTLANPEAGARFRRLLGRRPLSSEALTDREKGFELLCKSLGLHTAEQPAPPKPKRAPGATQLGLFSA